MVLELCGEIISSSSGQIKSPNYPENYDNNLNCYWKISGGDGRIQLNFKEHTGLYGGDENLHLTERFTKMPDGNLLYNFTVDDPTAWTASWSGEYVWKASTDKVFEYACHEGNYAMGNILRGARLLEEETLQNRAASSGEE